MKLTRFVLPVVFLSLASCGGANQQASVANQEPRVQEGELKKDSTASLTETANTTAPHEIGFNQLSRNIPEQAAQSLVPALDRKILRNGELVVEVDAPAEAQHKIATITDTLGGFVVTSESKQHQTADGKQQLEVNLVVRVPAPQFDAAMSQIRATGSRILSEKTVGEDVTEEFIDLEARLKTQTALEQQFLQIMKQARNVEDALSVQRQIADVRTDIEKLEGRKRFLDNRASLSTITVTLSSPGVIVVNTSGFGRSVRQAVSESVELVVAIVLFLIRFVIVMVPVGLLILLPLYFVARFFYRRALRQKILRTPVPQDEPATGSGI